MAQPGPFSGPNCWFQGGGHMCLFKPEGSSKLLHLHFWFRIFPKTFCSESLPSKSPASYTRLINMEVTWFMVKHGSFHRLICFFSKTLVSLQRTLLLNSYTLSFNLTLILQSPYFFDNTVSFKSYWFFLYPLYSNTASCICLLWIIHFFAFHHTCISTTCDLKILGFWTAPQFIWKLCPSIPTSYAESSGANEYAKKIWQKHDSRQSHYIYIQMWYMIYMMYA